MKQCPKCPSPKPSSEFNKGGPRNPDGLDTYCRDHRAIVNAAYSAKYKIRKQRIRGWPDVQQA
jgi:hypothetical protein